MPPMPPKGAAASGPTPAPKFDATNQAWKGMTVPPGMPPPASGSRPLPFRGQAPPILAPGVGPGVAGLVTDMMRAPGGAKVPALPGNLPPWMQPMLPMSPDPISKKRPRSSPSASPTDVKAEHPGSPERPSDLDCNLFMDFISAVHKTDDSGADLPLSKVPRVSEKSGQQSPGASGMVCVA